MAVNQQNNLNWFIALNQPDLHTYACWSKYNHIVLIYWKQTAPL